MGCSYDPVPHNITPPPEEVWMIDNHFSHHGKEKLFTMASSCGDCGVVLNGNKNVRQFLVVHLPLCPVNPRDEVVLKTPEECKSYTYQAWS